jgi:hypothetical protein
MELQIAHVILWSNGMVTVFDRGCQQLPDYQGRLEDVREAILRDALPATWFEGGTWRPRRARA